MSRATAIILTILAVVILAGGAIWVFSLFNSPGTPEDPNSTVTPTPTLTPTPTPTQTPNITPTPSPNPTPGTTEPAAVGAARKSLAAKLAVSEQNIAVMKFAEMDWNDSCLGLGGIAESCLQVITPGFKVEMSVNGKTYVYRTDKSGSVVRAETL